MKKKTAAAPATRLGESHQKPEFSWPNLTYSFPTPEIYSDESARSALEKNFPVVGMTSLEFGADDVGPEDLANRVFQHYLGGVDLREENADLVTQVRQDLTWLV